MVELMNPGRIPNVVILVGTNNVSRSSDEEEARLEAMMVCLFATLWRGTENQLRGTDFPHCTHEHKDVDSNRKKTQ